MLVVYPRLLCACTLVLVMGTAHASFVESCVLYGQAVNASDQRQQLSEFEFAVQDVIALRGSHTHCQTYVGQTVSVTLKEQSIDRGDWLLLRYERQDGLCEVLRGCSSEQWQLLKPVAPAPAVPGYMPNEDTD